ncbi:hypothetical protein T459_21933 [Capsicum annuum]|uniref:Uncharacterized protein n=1 Tax=Capsicum annuum TaxID=4072 RepID=A0A2G2YY37_CAPAN|nr:hypothetical protein T459_21933 [Capsicum annuum]
MDAQGIQINQQYFLFELKGTDLVLGMEWLVTLGEMRVNWKLQIMKFNDAGRSVFLRGDPAMVRTVVSLKSMTKLLKKRNQGFFVELNQVTRSENEDAIITMEIEKLLSDYPEVGEQTLSLLPHRSRDHAITLQTGAQSPNIRPY